MTRRHCQTCTCVPAETLHCVRCHEPFTRGGHDGERRSQAIFCSRRCARAASQQAWRDRQKRAIKGVSA